ncbi:unnamed protein product [Colias eurytheme]|nr:unnamed protein product [Colias eurytheme]
MKKVYGEDCYRKILGLISDVTSQGPYLSPAHFAGGGCGAGHSLFEIARGNRNSGKYRHCDHSGGVHEFTRQQCSERCVRTTPVARECTLSAACARCHLSWAPGLGRTCRRLGYHIVPPIAPRQRCAVQCPNLLSSSHGSSSIDTRVLISLT